MLAEYTGQEIENGVVRFTADWCQPCKAYAPIFARVAEETDTPFYVIDTQRHKDKAWELRLQSIPAVYAVKDGEWHRIVGPYDESVTREALAKVEA